MTHVPFGYVIKDGKAVVDEKQAEQIRLIFGCYNGGMSMAAAAKEAGIDRTHSVIKQILINKHYLGDDFYPQIIDEESFEKARLQRQKVANQLNRNNRAKMNFFPSAATQFHWEKNKKYYDDPFKQAEHLYGLIESE